MKQGPRHVRNVRRRARALRYEAADIGRTVGGGRAREPLERCSRELRSRDTLEILSRYSHETYSIGPSDGARAFALVRSVGLF